MTRSPSARAARLKILILKPSSLGDVVHAMPVLRLLKLEFPESEIHWWLEDRLRPLLVGDPDLAAVAPFERRQWRSAQGWWRTVRVGWGLRRQRFDWVIDLQALARSAWFAWLANGALTVGLDSGREGARGLYDRVVARPHPDAHAVEWNLAVLHALGVPTDRSFEWLPHWPDAAAAIRQRQANDNVRWIMLCPGARWENKRWPTANFAALIKHLLAADAGLNIGVLGGREDQPLGRVLATENPGRCLDLTGQTSLPELVEWLRLGELLVNNDTGPMHIAAALGKPVVALFGPTHAGRTGPWQAPGEVLQADLPCVPCRKRTCANPIDRECLHVLSPERVAAAVGRHWPAAPAGEC